EVDSVLRVALPVVLQPALREDGRARRDRVKGNADGRDADMEIQPSPILPSRGVASPSLASDAGGGDAFEVKYRLTTQEADGVQAWARERLTPDPHGENGVYGTTSLYLDTSVLDIYHKTRGYRRSKYRLRRYGSEEWVHME